LDADSDGEEGLYYTWTEQEFKGSLGQYGELIGEYFGVGLQGEWENGRNILLRPFDDPTFAQLHFLSEEELKSLVRTSRKSLLEVRSARMHPGMDDKVLVSWNALMIKAYVDAYMALGNTSYFNSAIKAAIFILTEMKNPGGCLFHTWKNGVARIPAFLDDYAFFAESLLSLYQCSMDPSWLKEADTIVKFVQLHFTDAGTGMFYFSQIDHHNVIRKVESYDSVIPSSNSSMARVLHALGTLTGTNSYMESSLKMLEIMNYRILNFPQSSGNWACLALEMGLSHHVIAIVGEDAEARVNEINRHFIPNALVVGSTGPSETPYLKGRYLSGETLIHICTENACFAPVETVDKALQLLGAHLGMEN